VPIICRTAPSKDSMALWSFGLASLIRRLVDLPTPSLRFRVVPAHVLAAKPRPLPVDGRRRKTAMTIGQQFATARTSTIRD
jgi:hypothetical protein